MSGDRIDRSAAAGYAGKPVWRKLGLAPELRIRVVDAPADYAERVGLDGVTTVGASRAFDVAHVFATSAARLEAHVQALAKALPATGVLWMSWPKRASKVPTGVTEDTVRAIALPLGLVDVKVCAIDAAWSGLEFAWRRAERVAR